MKLLSIIFFILLSCSYLHATLTIEEVLGKTQLKILKKTKSNEEIMEIARERYNYLKSQGYSDVRIRRITRIMDTRQQRLVPKD